MCKQPEMYQQVETYLKNSQWREADQETDILMLQILGKKPDQWLNKKDIKNFPSEKLLILDRLWTEYSQGKFGFSIQKQIWLKNSEVFKNFDLNVNEKIAELVYKSFAQDLGWKYDERWLPYDNFIFSLNESNVGHLPSLRSVLLCLGRGQDAWVLKGVGVGAILYVNLFSYEDL